MRYPARNHGRAIGMAAAATLCLVTGKLYAATYNFSCISDNSVADCAIGESQLFVEVSSVAGNQHQAQFTFYNTGPADSSIEGIYFDDGTLLDIAYLVDKDEGSGGLPGVDFSEGSASPPELPGAQEAISSFETTAGFLADSDAPTSKMGINPDEWLTIVFDLQSNQTADSVFTDLSTGALRIGIHAIDFASAGSESFINNPTAVPAPVALLLFGSALLAMTGVAIRKHCHPPMS